MEESKSLEQALVERLSAPVRTKAGTLAVDENGQPLTATEAIAMSITQNAIRGDLAAASFIRNITRSQGRGSDELQAEYHRRKTEAVASVKKQLEKEGLWTGQQIEAEPQSSQQNSSGGKHGSWNSTRITATSSSPGGKSSPEEKLKES